MHRYSLAVVLLLTTAVYTPVQAPVSVTARSSVSQKLTPFSLVSLAYQGRYREQGINGYSRIADSASYCT